MKNLDPKLQNYINELINVARPKVTVADQGAGSKLANEVVRDHALTALHVYQSLDHPNRTAERYHDKNFPRVMLDPMTVLNRSKDLQASIDDLEFWQHPDMIKALADYLEMRYGGEYA